VLLVVPRQVRHDDTNSASEIVGIKTASAVAARERSSRLRSVSSSSSCAGGSIRRHLDQLVVLDIGSAFSRVMRIGGVRRTASSFDVVRILVSCLP